MGTDEKTKSDNKKIEAIVFTVDGQLEIQFDNQTKIVLKGKYSPDYRDYSGVIILSGLLLEVIEKNNELQARIENLERSVTSVENTTLRFQPIGAS